MTLENLKNLIADCKEAALVTDYQFSAVPNQHSDKPATYETGECRITGTSSMFNRIFAEVLNDEKTKAVIIPKVIALVKAEAITKKQEYLGQLDIIKKEAEKL